MCNMSLEKNHICNEIGECLGSGLVGIAFPENYEDCLKDCQTRPNCKWVTYRTELKLCKMLDGCKEFSTNCSTCISGQVECGKETKIY